VKHSKTRETVDPIVEAAADWFVRLHEDPADPTLRPAFTAWREADPRHALAYERLRVLWGASAHLPSLIRAPASPDRRMVLRAAAGAGGTLAAVAVGGRLALGPHPFAAYRTRPGETARVTLADGSRVELSTSTALGVDLGGQSRDLTLLRGEAWFDASPRDHRPFVVKAAGGRVTAGDGGAFGVALDEGGGMVSAGERPARVALRGAEALVPGGFRLAYADGALGVARLMDADSLAWRDGRLVFVNQPLSKVAAALDRWTGGRTLILDPALAARPVTLIAATSEAGAGLERLARAAPMRLWRRASVTVITSV
jgi:transmembrane sensor